MFIWDDVIAGAIKIIDKVIPDPQAKAEAQFKIMQLQQQGEFKQIETELALATAQTDINKVEAANPNLWVSGWRPAIGWTSALALFTYYVPYCITATIIWAHLCWTTGTLAARPDLGIADLIGLVASMLGVASLRTYEKKLGVN